MAKKNVVEIKRSDFAVLHNNLNEAIWKIAIVTTGKRGMTQEESMEVFKLLYPLAKGTQDIVFNEDFNFCIAAMVKQ